jgi:DNA replication protein DnaC
VRILHLAASTAQRPVEDALLAALERGTPLDYASIKALTHPDEPAVPVGVDRRARLRALRRAARCGRCLMTASYTPEVGDRIAALFAEWELPMMSAELVTRMADAGHDGALALLAEVCELEADSRRERRVDRLRRASKLPPGKTFESLDRERVPRTVFLKVQELARGDFLDRADNALLFGLPGVGKSHLACALGHALIDAGRSVLFVPTYQLVQQLLAARRGLELPRALRALDVFDAIILDDIGYVEQTADEAEVLFPLMAERYERRSLIITSNLVFSEWGRIFKTPMTTAAAIDRLVHHAVIIEIDRASVRAEEAKKKNGKKKSDED